MKCLIILCIMFIACGSLPAQSKPYFPKALGFVNDYEDDFTDGERKALDHAMKDLLSQTMEKAKLSGIEMAVVTVTDSMFGDSKEMSTYATMLGDKWGLGTKSPNRGIIIAYGKKVRKVALVTGAGLDEILPKEVCHTIVNEKMTAEFRKGRPYDAIYAAVKAIGEYLGIVLK